MQFEGRKAHLAGVSNGGVSAYRVITEYPGRFLSLTVLPGVPPDERAFNALGRLQGITVAAFVGGEDSEWVRRSPETKRKLDSLGIENTLEIVAGAGRVVPLDPTKLGFNCLAIDQRSGGDLFGQQNETVRHVGHKGEYEDVLKDMEAALAWARSSGNNGRVLVWGSSYSAALVFLLAAEHPQEVAGVPAFSPNEYLDGPHAVHAAAAKVSVPIFVTSARDGNEITAAKSILAVSPAPQKTQFVPRIAGVHGSSTLREDKNRGGAAENWRAVEEFLSNFRPTE